VLTQCPNCDTTFRVTSEILRVAQGQVRCGRCDTQFDALERLIEEEEEASAEEADFEAGSEDLRLSEPDPEEQTEDWVEFEDLEAQSEDESAPADAEDNPDFEAAEQESDAEPLEAEQDAEEIEEIEEVEEEEEEEEPEPDDAQEELEYQRAVAEAKAKANNARPNYTAERGERRFVAQPQSKPARQFDDTDQFELNPRPVRLPSAAVWKYLAAPLGLLLVLQVLNHYRAPLARHPRLGNTVSGIYRLLGVNLIPDWNLRAYEIKKWGVVSDPSMPAGTLQVRASVRNRAAFPQPYPLVKVVLEDRFGGLVRAREFEPTEYLDKPPPPNSRMAPQQEVRATIAIVDPGTDASGYRFDVCLQGNNGSVCADDVPQTSP
jgi:predicted Zn finger-like uncharacterized protein